MAELSQPPAVRWRASRDAAPMQPLPRLHRAPRLPVVGARVPQEGGQATVEFVALMPVVLLLGTIVWQLALAGHTAWMCAHAARAAARAEAVGRDGTMAARSALPKGLERGLRVRRRPGGGVRVKLGIPLLLHRWRSGVSVSATASLGAPP